MIGAYNQSLISQKRIWNPYRLETRLYLIWSLVLDKRQTDFAVPNYLYDDVYILFYDIVLNYVNSVYITGYGYSGYGGYSGYDTLYQRQSRYY